jgi:hypothetical protein
MYLNKAGFQSGPAKETFSSTSNSSVAASTDKSASAGEDYIEILAVESGDDDDEEEETESGDDVADEKTIGSEASPNIYGTADHVARGILGGVSAQSGDRAVMRFRMPWAEVVTHLNDAVKSLTAGYASLDWSPGGYSQADGALYSHGIRKIGR